MSAYTDQPPPTEVVFRLRGIQKMYEQRAVVDIESLEIRQGEILALVGPSGSGKSTLLRLLNFLEPPTAGTLEFGGFVCHNVADVPLELKRRVTTVFQRTVLLERDVWDNVAYGLKLRGQYSINERVQAAIQQVGMASQVRQRARTLSGGESQRVALARSIVLHPDVLLLDEPTANLDPYNVGLIENITREINQQRNTTIVLVTHNVFQAKRLADRVAFLLDGKLIEVAGTEQFFQSPQDSRTAAFVRGDMVY